MSIDKLKALTSLLITRLHSPTYVDVRHFWDGDSLAAMCMCKLTDEELFFSLLRRTMSEKDKAALRW